MLKLLILLICLINISKISTQLCTFEYNIDYMGNDLNLTKVDRLEDCCNLCFREQRCRVWTYVEPTSLCYLKDSIGSRRLNSVQSKINNLSFYI